MCGRNGDMKKTYQKCGFTVVCCLAVVTASACSNKASSKEDNKSNYVIQEIIATDQPEDLHENQEKSDLVNEEIESSELSGLDKKEIESMEPFIASDASSASTSASASGIIESKELVVLGSVYQPDSVEVMDNDMVQYISTLPAGSNISMHSFNAATLSACFTSEEISPTIFNRMENKSFSEGCTTKITSLRYIRVLHYGFDGEIYVGELIVNQKIEKDIIEIFKELFDAKYPIEKMLLIDEFDADDNLSMEANNTSSFNFRMVDGTTSLSKHAYGLAIDINPMYNPYVRTVNKQEVVVPVNGTEYADRSLECEYYIKKDDVVYKIFNEHGFTWGGDWTSSKDYQHFQKVFQ